MNFIGIERQMNFPQISQAIKGVLDSARGRKIESKIPILTWAFMGKSLFSAL